MALQKRLTCLFFLGVGSLYVPNLGKYLQWGASHTLELLPQTALVPDEKVALISDWFRPMDGSARYYFSRLENGFRLYTGPGICPQTGQTLKEVRGDVLGEIKVWSARLRVDLKQEESQNVSMAQEAAHKQEQAERQRLSRAASSLPETNSPQQAIWPVIMDPNTASGGRTVLRNALVKNPVVLWDGLNPDITDDWFMPLWGGDRSPLDSLDLAARLDGLLLVQINIHETEGQSVAGLKVARGTLQIKTCPVSARGEVQTWLLEATQPAATAEAARAGLAKQFQEKFIAEVQPHLKP